MLDHEPPLLLYMEVVTSSSTVEDPPVMNSRSWSRMARQW